MSETSDLMKEMVETIAGDSIAIHEPQCMIWKADHDNCVGCPTELGCGKMVHMMLVSLTPLYYKPKDYDDFTKMHNRVQELMYMTLKAESVEELHLVPHM